MTALAGLAAWATLGAALALVGVYAYAASALFAHARLAALPAPRSLAHAIAVGALMPACGCTALAYARRASPRLRAPFLVAAYAVNPLLLVAAALLGGWRAALLVLALGLAAALVARAIPQGERPRARLDDLLLRRGASPLRDAAPYTRTYAAPAIALGAFVGLASLAPPYAGALAVGALALLFGAPHADVAQDHGARLATGIRVVHVAFAAACALIVALV